MLTGHTMQSICWNTLSPNYTLYSLYRRVGWSPSSESRWRCAGFTRHGTDGGLGALYRQRRAQFLGMPGWWVLSAGLDGRLDFVLAAALSAATPLVFYEKHQKSLLSDVKPEHALHQQHSMLTIRRTFCRSDEAAGADGGRMTRGEILRTKFLIGRRRGRRFISCRGILAGAAIDMPLPICRAEISNGCCWRRRCCCGFGGWLCWRLQQRQSGKMIV